MKGAVSPPRTRSRMSVSGAQPRSSAASGVLSGMSNASLMSSIVSRLGAVPEDSSKSKTDLLSPSTGHQYSQTLDRVSVDNPENPENCFYSNILHHSLTFASQCFRFGSLPVKRLVSST